MKTFSKNDRARFVDQLKTDEFDMLIIGGGITGAGIARDAASRGMKVALIEGQDFSEGTSSRSSKLVHGGIRYLENYEFGLVFEALTERKHLFKLAPHLVHPLRFLLPVYKDSRVGMFLMSLGMWLYDALALFKAPKLHERLNPKKSLARIPILQGKDMVGSFEYSDAYMDDDRLVIETLRSANEMGATSVNFVRALSANKDDQGNVISINAVDQMTKKGFTIKAKHFISAVGPWTDYLGESFFDDWIKKMRPSKGVHLTFKRDRIPLASAVVMATGERIVFAIPRHEMVIIGTTDTDFKENPKDVCTTPEDVEYLLQVTRDYFPGANITKEDIIGSYAGVRPLISDGASTESKTSREHMVISDPRNLTVISGGKYTTYRRMAEDTVKVALKSYSKEDQIKFKKNDTIKALNPKVTTESFKKIQDKIKTWSEKLELSETDTSFLIDRHGGEVEDFTSWLDDKDVKSSQNKKWAIEAKQAIKNTMCINLVDFYIRRTPLLLSQKDHGLPILDEIAGIFKKAYNWDNNEVARQKEMIKAHLSKEMGWK